MSNSVSGSDAKTKSPLVIKIICIVLAVLVAGEGVAIGVLGVKLRFSGGANEPGDLAINADFSSVGVEIGRGVGEGIAMLAGNLMGDVSSGENIGDIIRGVVYSDALINTLASISYPLVKKILVDLNMLQFATAARIWPTPAELAELFKDKSYTACDKSGTILPLADVLTAAEDDWAYFDTTINLARDDGTVNSTTLWNTIQWGVKDRESFYSAMNDMSEGIRGVLEVTMQGKTVVCNVNLVKVLLGSDFANLGMDAAEIYTPLKVCGYEGCLVPLFAMLGLAPAEYPSVEEFKGYTSCADIWKAILEPVLTAVDKAIASPTKVLPSMLVNFADQTDSGVLYKNMQTMTMYGKFDNLAKSFMGFEDKELANLGVVLADVIKGFGIDITGSFNDILDDLLGLITGKENADMPDMDVKALLKMSKKVSAGNDLTVYSADSEQVINYLASWLIDSDIARVIIDMTEIAGTQEAQNILEAIDNCEKSLECLVSLVVPLVKQKLERGVITATRITEDEPTT
ncbi:MAG: hypothetical protein K6G90_08860 [Clostridia bacterium]|nr:hypothetical protein [Clostridia bacterium]